MHLLQYDHPTRLTQHAQVLELLVLYVLDDDLLVGLDLKHLQHQAQEVGGLALAAMRAAHAPQLDGLLDERLGGEGEALVLPVDGLVDFLTHDLLHQVLRVGAVHRLGQGVGAVGHGG